jgi:membrane fusion protein (multidrug efflux system)
MTTRLFRSLAAVSLLVAACGEQAPPPAPPPAVEYHATVLQDVITSVEVVARLRAREDTAIQAQISGTITERNFREGQEVQKDASLYRIDPRPYEAALSSAQAQLTNAIASMEVAERNLKRGEELSPDGFISQAELDKLRGERDQAVAAIEGARAAVENAKINLEFTDIRAPFTGMIGRSEVSIGDLVSPQTGPLVTLVQSDPMLADFDVSERALANALKANQEALARGEEPIHYTPTLLLVTGDTYPEPGEIDYASNRVNASTGTVTITARFPNPGGMLVPGQFVRLRLQRGESEQRLLIPQQSVLEDMQGRYVFIVDGEDHVARRNVELGQRHGVMWVVENGLEEGDRVIVNGIQKVRSGMTVSATPVESMPHEEGENAGT